MQWENPPKIEWQTTLLQEKHHSCILWFSMQSLRWAKARAQPDRPSGAILAAFGRRQPPSGRLGLRPSLPAGPPKIPFPASAGPCKPQALARRVAVLRTALAAGGRLRRRAAAPALRARFRHKLIPPASPQHRLQLPALQRRCQRRPVRESSAARLVGFFRGSSCPKGTK